MNENPFLKSRLYITGVVSLAIGSLLLWNHFHGGVPSHSILAREDMPSISNWWGALVLPLLTWFLLYRIEQRLRKASAPSGWSPYPSDVVFGFAGALLFGIVLSTSFALKYADVPFFMLISIFGIALFLPIYRSEYLLGFVIGMTYVFGAVLPTGIGSILVLLSAVIYLVVRPGILWVVRVARPGR